MSSTRQIGTDPYDRFNDDPSRHKHGGTDTSRSAWEKAKRGRAKSQLAVLSVLQKAHPEGMTAREIASVLNKELHKISGRVTELLEEGAIRKSPETRKGGHVLYLAEIAESSSLRHPASSEVPNTIRQEIERLYNEGRCWDALALASKHNIPVSMEMESATI